MPGPSQITRITSARASGSSHSPTAAGTSGGPTSVTAAVVVGPSLANAASDCPMAARVEAAPVVLAVPDVEAAVDEPASGAAISDADGVASPEPSAVDAPEGRPSGLAGTVVRRSDGVDGDTSSDGVVACGSCRATVSADVPDADPLGDRAVSVGASDGGMVIPGSGMQWSAKRWARGG